MQWPTVPLAAPPPLFLSPQVLNEVVIDRGASPYLTGLELACNERHVADVQGDGRLKFVRLI